MKSYIFLIQKIIITVSVLLSGFLTFAASSAEVEGAHAIRFRYYQEAVTWAQYYRKFISENLEEISEDDDQFEDESEDPLERLFSDDDEDNLDGEENADQQQQQDDSGGFLFQPGEAMTEEEIMAMEKPDALYVFTAQLPFFMMNIYGVYDLDVVVKSYPVVAKQDLFMFLTANENHVRLIMATDFTEEGMWYVSQNPYSLVTHTKSEDPFFQSLIPDLEEENPNFFKYLSMIYKVNALFQSNHGVEAVLTNESLEEKDIGDSGDFIVFPFNLNPELSHSQMAEFLFLLNMTFENAEDLKKIELLNPGPESKSCSIFLG